MGIALRGWFVVVAAAAVAVACEDTNDLTGGEDALDAGPTKPKDAGSTPIGDDGGGPITPSGRCDPLKPFGAPDLVTEFDPQATTTKGAVLSPDELEVFYLRYTGTGGLWDLRHARRSTRDGAWGPVVTDTMTPPPQGFLSLTAAGKKMYFWTIDHPYRASRGSTAETFGTPTQWDVASGPWPFVVAADDTAYFAKYGDGAAERFIHRASVDNYGFSTRSSEVPNVHVAGANDSRPVLNASETIMYFASNRTGGRGLDDVWVAHRASKQDEFGAATHVRELSTDDPDYVTWVSDDDCVVFLDRASHVYVARRPL